MTARDLRLVVGAAAIGFSALYVLSGVMELAAGELYTAQLWVTYAEAPRQGASPSPAWALGVCERGS